MIMQQTKDYPQIGSTEQSMDEFLLEQQMMTPDERLGKPLSKA